MTPEGFTIEQVEDGLRKVFGEKPRKEITGHMDKGKFNVRVNAVHQPVNKKRKVAPGVCFYCHEDGHFKADCPRMKSDRNPNRPGGPIFRTDVNTAPGANKGKSKAVRMAKAIKAEAVNVQTPSTPGYETGLPPSPSPDFVAMEFPNGSDVEEDGSEVSKMDYEVCKRHSVYFAWLGKLQLTDTMWIVDTGAGHAITPGKSWFCKLRKGNMQTFVYGNGGASESSLIGDVWISVCNPNGIPVTLSIKNVAYDPKCESNLLSACYLAKQGLRFLQSKSGKFLYFLGKDGKLAFAAVAIGDVYYLPTQKYHPRDEGCQIFSMKKYNHEEKEKLLKEWHPRIGHANIQALIRMICAQSVTNIPLIPYGELKEIPFFCKTCALGKPRRMSHRGMVGEKATQPLHTLHMDSVGKMKVQGLYGGPGYKYALAVVDDATGFKWYLVLKSLTEVRQKIKDHVKRLEVQFPYKVRRIRTDGGTEFVTKVLEKYCNEQGIIFEKSNVESQEENGSAERAHQTVMGKARCALLGARMPARWWPEALLYATTVTNCLLHARLGNKSPYEVLYGKSQMG